MSLIIKPRGYCKSTDLVKISAASGVPILAFNTNMKRLYEIKCKELKLDSDKVRINLWEDIKNEKIRREKLIKF